MADRTEARGHALDTAAADRHAGLASGWELAAEFYAMGRSGQDYARLYRKVHPRLTTALFFWAGMSGLAVAGTVWLLGGREDRDARR